MARRFMPETDLKVILDKLECGMFGQPCSAKHDKTTESSHKSPPKKSRSISNGEIHCKTGLGLLGALMARKPATPDYGKAAAAAAAARTGTQQLDATDALMQRLFEVSSQQESMKQDVVALEAQNTALRAQLAEQDELLQRQQMLVEQANEKLQELQFYKMQAMLAEGRADVFLDARAALERKHKKELTVSRRSTRLAVTRVLELEKELDRLRKQQQQQPPEDQHHEVAADDDADQAIPSASGSPFMPSLAITKSLSLAAAGCAAQ